MTVCPWCSFVAFPGSRIGEKRDTDGSPLSSLKKTLGCFVCALVPECFHSSDLLGLEEAGPLQLGGLLVLGSALCGFQCSLELSWTFTIKLS